MNVATNKKALVLALTLVLFISTPLFVNTQHTVSAQGLGNGKIVFHSDRDGNYEIYVMNADGSNQINLTNNLERDTYPTWSPDGTKIAFSRKLNDNEDIYVMDADGSNLTRLTYNAAHDVVPAWSPDGTKIAFMYAPTSGVSYWEIYVMNADGSNQTNLTNNSVQDADISWSPDGTQIAFSSIRDGNWEIYLMNADGSNLTRITNNSAYDNKPDWSPEGTQIAFTSDRDGNWEIYVMEADGSNPINLTNNPARDIYSSWSSAGTRMAFSSNRNVSETKFEVYVMDADGSNPTRLTNSTGNDNSYPDWYNNAGGCAANVPTTAYQGDSFTLTLSCANIDNNVFGFQAGHTITAGANLVAAQSSTYTAGTIFQGQSTLVGSNTLSLYALSLQAGGIQASGDFTLGFVDHLAVAPGQATFDLINLILGDINGEAIAGVQASPSAATVTIKDLILSLSGLVDPQGYAHADNLTFELEGSPVYANLTKTFVPADGTTGFTYTNIKGHSDWLQVDGPSHVTCQETLTFPADAGNETLPPDLILRAGDVNDDDAIDLTDAAAIGQQYGQTPTGGLDINNDGVVNILDLIHVGRNYNTTGPTDCTS